MTGGRTDAADALAPLSSPAVSVVVTTHTWDRYGAFRDAIRSVQRQTYADTELVCPIDADADMADATRAIADGGVTVEYDPDGTGLSAARNRGARAASGDVYAFLDDDCVASETWVETLVAAYEDGAIAAGGPAVPEWPTERPWYVPREWDWLVGGGPYHDREREVRNTYGCNLSVRADVFDALGGFDESLGKAGNLEQAEETEFCTRMRERYGEGVRYRPTASVRHRVFAEQLRVGHLLRRAYAQGRAKRRIGLDDEETGFLRETLVNLVRQPPHRSAATLAFTAATGAGYLFG